MNNSFLDLLKKQQEEDNYVTAIPEVEDNILQEDYPTLDTLPDIGPKDPLEEIRKEAVASSVPELSAQKDLLASNDATKAVEDVAASLELPKTDEDVESDESTDKVQDFKTLLEEYRANREGRAKAIEAVAEQDRKQRLLQNLSKAFAQIGTGLSSGYANIKVDPIDLGPADAEAKARAAQKERLSELLTQLRLQKEIEPKKVSEMEKIQLETAKERLKQLKEKPKIKEEIKKEKPLTKGQEALDRAFAKEYSDYVAAGGYASVQKNLQDLNKVVERLEKDDKVTGTLREKIFPSDYVRSLVNEEAQDLKDTVERVIQQSLRQTLGAQFTEKEATRLIERSYNPRLSDEKNIERLKQTIKEIQNMAEAKQKAADYFEEKGTLTGYKGKVDIKKAPKIKVNIPGKGQGTIDSDKLEDFLKAYPNAKVME